MKGTGKQIKWAEDIMATAKKNLELMFHDAERLGSVSGVHGWKYAAEDVKAVSAQLEMIAARIDDAGMIINKRNMFERQALEQMASESYFQRTGKRF